MAGDLIFVLLGCPVTLILRSVLGGKCQVVGDCNVPGLMRGEALLGSLPAGFSYVPLPMREDGRPEYLFLNTETGEDSPADPRLEKLCAVVGDALSEC